MTEASLITSETLWRILDLTRRLALPLALKPTLERVLETVREVLDAERVSILLYDRSCHELYATVATGVGELRFSADRGIAGECVRTRQTITVPDCYSDPRFNRDIDRVTGFHTRCLMSVPLVGFDESLVGVLQVMNHRRGVFTADDTRMAEVFASQCAVAIQRAQLLEEHQVKLKLEHDLTIARDIQLQLLPARLPELRGYELAAWSSPADQTGGDIYDVAPLDDLRCAFLLGDATGHGIGPALSIIQVRAMLRMAMRLNCGLSAAVSHLNSQLAADLASDRFVAAVTGILDTGRHCVTYRALGLAPLLHWHAAQGSIQALPATAPPLGVVDPLPPEEPATLFLEPGDMLALLTDGFFETRAPGGELFGEGRVCEVLRHGATVPLAELIQQLRRATASFRGAAPQADDMTALLIRRQPPVPAP